MGEVHGSTGVDGESSRRRLRPVVSVCLLAALAAGPSRAAPRGRVRTSGTVPVVAVSPATPEAPTHERAAVRTAEGERLVFSAPSPYGPVLVLDRGNLRILRLGSIDGLDQSYLDLRDPRAVPMEYVRFAALGLAYVPRPRRVLMIGLGGGSFSALVHRAVPGARVEVVEINPVVCEVARRYFGMVEDANYRVHVADGAAYLEASRSRYDIVFVDAYSSSGIPAHLTTARFFASLRRHLDGHGLLVANIALVGAPASALVDTIAGVFPDPACALAPESGNLLVFASPAPLPGSRSLRQRAERRDRTEPLAFALAPLVSALTACRAPHDHGPR